MDKDHNIHDQDDNANNEGNTLAPAGLLIVNTGTDFHQYVYAVTRLKWRCCTIILTSQTYNTAFQC